MSTARYEPEPGSPHPLGARPDAEGTNFSLFSQHGTSVQLLLFEHPDDLRPTAVLQLHPDVHRTVHFWHVYVKGARPGIGYAYRVDGPRDRRGAGHRFNPSKVLIDPYAWGTSDNLWNRAAACNPDDNVETAMRSVVVDISDYDWEGDQPLRRPMNETVIYEMHVGGFTKSPTSAVAHPGTFAGVIDRIPYLKDLGITAVELLPVFEFDEWEIDRISPASGQRLSQYWGYSPISFFTPHEGYCISPLEGQHLREFRDMVKALHRAGIEVILDVVFNHTGEGNHLGPTISFKGLDNRVYYHLEPDDKQYYSNYSGTGNTLNCNHPVMEKFIIECLRFWVREMHVDGFRFDLASILTRGTDGRPMADPPVVWQIEMDNDLADTKIIAEAWDAVGLYQVAYFPGYRWAEWNGKYRDDIRRFVKGDPGVVGVVASRIAGSADLYQANGERPGNTINFVTAHDGFTLNDLVSYNEKHNEANGEENRDGHNENLSWNCGVEGPTDHPEITALRARQIKNFFAILLLSQGVPMLLAGDECRQTQHGNNNAYCQDNEIAWFDWERTAEHHRLIRFVKELIAFRRRHKELRRTRYFTGEVNSRGLPDIAWHGCKLNAPGWNDPNSCVLAFTIADDQPSPGVAAGDIHVILNMDWRDLDFELPSLEGRRWYRAVDTSLSSPEDIAGVGQEPPMLQGLYTAKQHSVIVLVSKAEMEMQPEA